MAWSLGQSESEVVGQREDRAKVELGQAFGGYTDEIIDVPRRTVFSTFTMADARARHAGVVGSRERWNSGPV